MAWTSSEEEEEEDDDADEDDDNEASHTDQMKSFRLTDGRTDGQTYLVSRVIAGHVTFTAVNTHLLIY